MQRRISRYSGSTIDGTEYPPLPNLAQSTRSPSSPNTTGPTMLPLFSARTCNSSRRAASETSKSSMIGSDSSCVSNVFSWESLNRMFRSIIDFPERGREIRPLQFGERIGDEHRLHELLRHADVEK